MRGDNSETTLFEQFFDNRPRYRAALFRVCSRADFVDQNKRFGIDVVCNFDYISDMRRKRRQILLYTLLVAHVAENVGEIRYFRSFGRRDEKSAHRHKRKKPRQFESDRFTAGVWSRYQQVVILIAERKVYRNNLVFINKRMPAVNYYRFARTVDFRSMRSGFISVNRPCVKSVHIDDYFFVRFESGSDHADFFLYFVNDSFDFELLFDCCGF